MLTVLIGLGEGLRHASKNVLIKDSHLMTAQILSKSYQYGEGPP